MQDLNELLREIRSKEHKKKLKRGVITALSFVVMLSTTAAMSNSASAAETGMLHFFAREEVPEESIAEEAVPVEETPAAEEIPAEPVAEETPAPVEEVPAAVEEAPAEETPAVVEEAPAEEIPAVAEEAPAEEVPAVVEETPAEETPAVVEETPAPVVETPAVAETPVPAGPRVFTSECKDTGKEYTVEVTFDDPNALPADAQLSVKVIEETINNTVNAEYTDYIDKIENKLEENKEIKTVQLFDITFTVNGAEVEPKGLANVKITSKALDEVKKEDLTVLHFEQNNEIKELDVDAKTAWNTDQIEEVKFDTDSFSVYAFVEVVEKQPEPAPEPVEEPAKEETPAEEPAEETPAEPEKKEEETPAVVYTPKVFTYESEEYNVEVSFNDPTALPEDAEMVVTPVAEDTYNAYVAEIESTLAENQQVKSVQMMDISFVSGDETIDVADDANVVLTSNVVADTDNENLSVVRFEETAPVDVNAEAVENTEDAVQFEANPYSVYAIVGTETIEATVLTADGETYKITVNYTKEAEIPNGSELVVREILPGTPEYEEDRAQTQAALGTSDIPVTVIADEDAVAEETGNTADSVTYQVVGNAQSQLTFFRLFDISIMKDEKEIEPKVPVEVVITYVEPMATDGSSLDVVHFTNDGVEVMEEVTVSEDGTEITYQADSFSKYGTARSAVGEGNYIIYRDHSNSTDYALSYQNNGNLAMSGVTVSNGSVYSAQDNVVWTFTAVDGGYRISFVDNNGTTHYLRAQIPNNNNDGTLSTTTNVNDSTTVWTYGNNRLRATVNNRTRELRQNTNAFAISRNNGETIYLAKIQEPATITIHYVNESGVEIMATQTLPDSTSSGVTAIRDIVETAAGYTYHNTYIANGDNIRATQIVPELRGAGGGTWEYQVYGQEAYTQFSGNTDIYVVYGSAYGSGSGSGGGGGDDLNIDTPTAGKVVTPNTDGTFTLSLSITGEKDTGSDTRGANVIVILDTSNSMNYRQGSSTEYGEPSRFTGAVSSAQSVASELLGMNTDENPSLVEMCLVEFNWDVTPSGWYTDAGTANAQGIYPEGSFNRKIADAGRNSGTNWEGALQGAIAAANAHNDGDDTYIIFLTDGNPSAWTGTNNGQGRYTQGSEATTTTTSQYYYHISANYMHATDEARQIVQNGWNFYTIGMYGNVDVLEKLTNFAYTGRSDNNGGSDYYYPAAETSALIAALDDIAEAIKNSLAVAGVDFHDGIAQDVTHTALTTNVGTGTLGGVTYRKSGGETASYTVTTDSSGNATFNFSGTSVPGSVTTIPYKKIVDVEGSDPVEQDATAQVYAATYNGKTYYMPIATVSTGGDFEWDVSPLGTLENNATYTVSFVVWPDQDAYDYVTNLNNGISGYTWDYENEVEVKTPSGSVAYYTDGVSQYPNIVRYPTTPATFAAMSNTYQTVDYYVAKTEEEGGETTTTYVKGDPIALDIPDPMVLTGTNFTVTKRWDDSLDQSQLAKLIADAAAQGETYSITLNLTEDGAFYKSYTFEPVWNADTEKYDWPSQTINIAPALLVSHNPGGEYKTVTIDGTTYYVLNEGHEYVLEEADLDSHFEFVTETYHPALVNGVLMNVAFEVNSNDEIVDGSTAEIVGAVPLTTFAGVNTLKGGINIYKRVVDENEEIVDDDSTFKVQVALDHINQEGTQIWFDTYEVDPATGEIVIPTEEQLTHWINTTTGEITETEPTGYKDKVQVIDADKGIYKNASGVLYGVNGKTPVYDNETNYIGTGGYGNVSGYTNVLDIQDNWMIRIVNVMAGTTYEVTETQTNGMQPSYSYWHDNADSTELIVIGNAASNIRITNKIVNRKVIVYKTDAETTPNPLADAEFTINGETLTSGNDGYTEVIELPISDTPYDLVETEAPDGYNKLTSAVKVTVSSNGVSYVQAEVSGGQPQTAERDADGNYVIHVRNNSGVELPMTGGTGTLPYTLGGFSLIMGAALMYILRMRRERRLS